jgi:hypothetical protein
MKGLEPSNSDEHGQNQGEEEDAEEDEELGVSLHESGQQQKTNPFETLKAGETAPGADTTQVSIPEVLMSSGK